MPARSYSNFSLARARQSLSVASKKRSVAGTIATRKKNSKKSTPLSDRAQGTKLRRDFEDVYGRVSECINNLFIDEDHLKPIFGSLHALYSLGCDLTTKSSKAFTEENTKDFFQEWDKFANLFSEAYEAPPLDRLKSFGKSELCKISDIVEKLNTGNHSKSKNWEAERDNFVEHITAISEAYDALTDSKAEIEELTKLVSESSKLCDLNSNQYFTQSLDESGTKQDAVFQCHFHLRKLYQSIFDYVNDEPLVVECIQELNSISKALRELFEPREQSTNYIDKLSREVTNTKYRSQNIRAASPPPESNKGKMNGTKKDTSRQSKNDNSSSSKRSRSLDPSENYRIKRRSYKPPKQYEKVEEKLLDDENEESIDALEKEVFELRRKLSFLRETLKIHTIRKHLPPNEIDDLRHKQYIETYHHNSYLTGMIQSMEEHNTMLKKEMKSIRLLNEELEDGAYTQTVKFNSDKIQTQIKDLETSIKRTTEDLNYLKVQRTKVLKVCPFDVNSTEFRSALSHLSYEESGFKKDIIATKREIKQIEFAINKAKYQAKVPSSLNQSISHKRKSINHLQELILERRLELCDFRGKMFDAQDLTKSPPKIQVIKRSEFDPISPMNLESKNEQLNQIRRRSEHVLTNANIMQQNLVDISIEVENEELDYLRTLSTYQLHDIFRQDQLVLLKQYLSFNNTILQKIENLDIKTKEIFSPVIPSDEYKTFSTIIPLMKKYLETQIKYEQ